MKSSLIAAMTGFLLAWPQLAAAQSLSFTTKSSDSPITVTAEDGLEWQQDDKLFIARGNAKAVQDDDQVTADVLIAHYRQKPKPEQPAPKSADDKSDDTGTEVYRVDAIGHVVITTKDETSTGEAAVYDFDRKVLVVQGDPVTMIGKNGTVTAHHTLQYWQDEDVAVGDGDALAVDKRPEYEGRSLEADRLTAFFREDDESDNAGTKKTDNKSKSGQKSDDKSKKKTGDKTATNDKSNKNSPDDKNRDLYFIHGVGHVVLTTSTEVIHGDLGDYNLDTGMATVDGNVKMTRDNTQLNGGYAVVNVKGGLSHLYTNQAQARGAPAVPPRVIGLLKPKSATSDAPKPMATAPQPMAKAP